MKKKTKKKETSNLDDAFSVIRREDLEDALGAIVLGLNNLLDRMNEITVINSRLDRLELLLNLAVKNITSKKLVYGE